MFDLEKALIPKPQQLLAKGVTAKIAEFGALAPRINATGDDARIGEGVALLRKRLADLAAVDKEGTGYTITLSVDTANEKFANVEKAEAYYISVSEQGATLCGKDAAGALYAAVTFSQMLYLDGDDVCVECAEILDYPDFMRRGHFIESRYGTEFLTLQDWYNFIDYLTTMKINTLTISVYGCWDYQYDGTHVEYLYVPIHKYPQLKTPKNIKYYSVREQRLVHRDDLLPTMYEQDFLGEIIAYAKRKNILVKPLFNSLGHNSLLPRTITEISAIREDGTPSGYGFCTKNPRTYEVMFDIYDEIIDRYLLPNGVYDIQIGLDEVGKNAICHCPQCEGKTHKELMLEYIIKLCKHLKARGMKHIYIYHDMLYHHFKTVNEELRDLFIAEGIYDEVVLDWWTYEDPRNLFWGRAEGVNNLFHSVIKPATGYYHWSIPSENNENIRACAKKATELRFEGMESYSSLAYCYDKNYLTLADVAWNNGGIDDRDEFDRRYAYRHYPSEVEGAVEALNCMFEIMRDPEGKSYINRICRKLDYYFYSYREKDLSLKSFPGGAFKLIREEEALYLSYLEFIKEKSLTALRFFKRSRTPSHVNDIWTLTAMQYYYMATEYLSLYRLDAAYNARQIDAKEVIRTLEELILHREETMLLAEAVRIPANQYTYLRNMSVFRQALLDLLRYFKHEVAQGGTPKLDVLDWSHTESKALLFLR